MKDYLEHFDIAWDGREPLLPPRRSKPPRWWTMGGNIVTTEPLDPKETERLREEMRPKRAYNRRLSSPLSRPALEDATLDSSVIKSATVQPPSGVTCRVEEPNDGRIPAVQPGPAPAAGESTAEGAGSGRLSDESLSPITNHSETTTTETDK